MLFLYCLTMQMTVSVKKDCWVKVKKSSPKSLLADCWFSVGRQLADSIPTAHRQLTDSKPTAHRQLADSIPTAHRKLTDSKPTLQKKHGNYRCTLDYLCLFELIAGADRLRIIIFSSFIFYYLFTYQRQ